MNTWTLFRRFVLFGAPLALGMLQIWHPEFDPTRPDAPATIIAQFAERAEWWLTLHLLQLPLFGLLGLAIIWLTDGLRGRAVLISRGGAAIFVVFYTAVDAIAGISFGLATLSARGLTPEQQHIVGGVLVDMQTSSSMIAIGLTSTIAWIVAVMSAAYALRRAGVSRLPIFLLGFATLVFALGHAAPTGPVGMFSFVLAALWIEFWPRKTADRRPWIAPRSREPITS
jgi:hypothetical protein